MSQPITAVDIKKMTQTVLSNQLGTYIYENDYQTPAVAIDNPPNNVQVSGLEAIIPLFPNTQSHWVSCDRISRQDQWYIILIQRDAEIIKLPQAVDRLTRFLLNPHTIYSPQDDIIGSYPQCRITFEYSDAYETLINIWSLT